MMHVSIKFDPENTTQSIGLLDPFVDNTKHETPKYTQLSSLQIFSHPKHLKKTNFPIHNQLDSKQSVQTVPSRKKCDKLKKQFFRLKIFLYVSWFKSLTYAKLVSYAKFTELPPSLVTRVGGGDLYLVFKFSTIFC